MVFFLELVHKLNQGLDALHRGLGTNRMNIFTVRRSTQGLADYLKQLGRESDGVAIAYDSRLMSETFARSSSCMLS